MKVKIRKIKIGIVIGIVLALICFGWKTAVLVLIAGTVLIIIKKR